MDTLSVYRQFFFSIQKIMSSLMYIGLVVCARFMWNRSCMHWIRNNFILIRVYTYICVMYVKVYNICWTCMMGYKRPRTIIKLVSLGHRVACCYSVRIDITSDITKSIAVWILKTNLNLIHYLNGIRFYSGHNNSTNKIDTIIFTYFLTMVFTILLYALSSTYTYWI